MIIVMIQLLDLNATMDSNKVNNQQNEEDA